MTQAEESRNPASEHAQQLKRWHRWSWVARLLWWLAILVAALLGLTQILLHQVLVPKVQEYRPQLEREASDLLGVPVRIGSVQTLTGGLIPSFEFKEVSLLGPNGAVALRLPRVVAAVSVRSIWSLGFEQIYLEAPELDVRRDAQGRIRVAGLLFGNENQQHSEAADWFFSQAEFVIRNGTLDWTDELKATPSLRLRSLNMVVRNPGLHHRFHLEATPDAQWGDKLVVQADLAHAFWETQEGNWRRWTGEYFVELARVDVSELRRHTHWGGPVEQGRGAMRLWGELAHGQTRGITADVSLENVMARLGSDLPPLELPSLTGRLGGRQLDHGGFELFTQNLHFTTQDGVQWPGGNIWYRQSRSALSAVMQGELQADKLDLATLGRVADRLPLTATQHAWLRHWAPRGKVNSVSARWSGELAQARDWKVQANVSDLAVAAADGAGKEAAGRPGVEGLSMELDATSKGGRARVQIEKGSLTFPGVFEQPQIGVDELKGQLQWSVSAASGSSGERDMQVDLEGLQFANRDVQGAGTIRWRTARESEHPAGRWPGVLTLDMSLARADGSQVHRYLPLLMPQFSRDYLKAAIRKGTASDAKLRVSGNLADFPFDKAKGEFHVSAPIRDAHFVYMPALPAIGSRLSGTWPDFTELSGQLVIDRNSLEVRNATANVAGSTKLQVQKVQARIARLGVPVVEVQGEVKGPLADQLQVVRQSPLNELLYGALTRASGTGDALTQLQLTLPTQDIAQSKVQGKISLSGNDVRLFPELPPLSRVRAQMNFSEKGFSVKGAQARFLGGDVRLDGGTPEQAGPNDSSVQIRVQGTATALGLREARELGLVAQLAKSASGAFAYQATVGVRKGQPEVLVSTNLQGLALQLPAPLSKTAEQAMPLRYSQALRKDAQGAVQLIDDIGFDVGTLVNVDYVRDLSGAQPKVVSGTIRIGQPNGQNLPMPESGVYATMAADRLDVDAWNALLQIPSAQTAGGRQNLLEPMQAYMPNSMAIQARQLVVDGYVFNRVVVGGAREGGLWRANMDAEELSGYVELRQGQGNAPGSLYARLARLTLAATAASEIENVIEQPISVPALDVVVEDLEYKGRKFGRLEVDAVNQGTGAQREWRLRKLNLQMPEAMISAKGNWVRVGQQTTTAAPTTPTRARNIPRRTALQVRMEIQDAGKMLERFGMGELIRKTPGVIDGQISWVGSPFALDYPSLQGKVSIDMKEGQFLKVDPGAARLLGILSLQSLPRRLALDFRDVFSEGFAFDNIRGDAVIENGIAKTNNLQMKGVVAGVLMEGSANIAKETQDLHVVVVPEINAGSASLFAVAVNPVVGVGTFLAQAVLRRPLIKQNTQEFRIEGSWSDPRITKLESGQASPGPATPASSPEEVVKK